MNLGWVIVYGNIIAKLVATLSFLVNISLSLYAFLKKIWLKLRFHAADNTKIIDQIQIKKKVNIRNIEFAAEFNKNYTNPN